MFFLVFHILKTFYLELFQSYGRLARAVQKNPMYTTPISTFLSIFFLESFVSCKYYSLLYLNTLAFISFKKVFLVSLSFRDAY